MLSVRKSLTLSFLLIASSTFASNQIYSYKDDTGTTNFTTELYSIPEKYRSRAVPLESETSSPAIPVTPAAPLGSVVQTPPAKDLQVVTASGEYRMGDHDTRADAVRLALDAAKREALEQVATYLESVTEVRNLDVTRDEIRTYTAGIVMVLDQKISTHLDGQTVVIRADLTAQVDPNEVYQAITALRENESAKPELLALRTEVDQLHEQLDAANQALRETNVSPDQVQVLNQQRQQLLNQLQADALVSQAWTDWVYVSPIIYPYPWLGAQQVYGLLLQARQLHPLNRHLQIAQRTVTLQAGALPPTPPGSVPFLRPHSSLLVPPSTPQHFAPPLHQSPLTRSYAPAPNFNQVNPSTAPSRLSTPLPPTLNQTHPRHLAQPNPPVARAPYFAPHQAPHMNPQRLSPQRFGGIGGHSGGGGHSGVGHRGR
ncbi:MAG: DUF4124 domain-containing protein [Nitrospirota bacterium]